MADDELELNGIERYTKRSKRLILESHSSCEVPAGCGGVVLRWRDPALGLELQGTLWSGGEARAWLDGEPLTLNRFRLLPGEHVLFLELEAPRSGLLFVAYDRPGLARDASSSAPPTFTLRTEADGGWVGTAEDPGAAGRAPGFDASGWAPLVQGAAPVDLDWEQGRYRADRCLRHGAQLLLPDPAADRLWVRKRFEVPRG